MNYASATESAKLLKAALVKAFPGIKFSVKLSRGTAYGYCSVRWVDGPTTRQVDEICGRFEGSTFDGMQDMEIHVRQTLADGRQTGLRGVSTSRDYSRATAAKWTAALGAERGLEVPAVVPTNYSAESWQWAPDGMARIDQTWRVQAGEWFTTMFHRFAQRRAILAAR